MGLAGEAYSKSIFLQPSTDIKKAHCNSQPEKADMGKEIKAWELLVAPRVSECFGLPWSALVWYSLHWCWCFGCCWLGCWLAPPAMQDAGRRMQGMQGGCKGVQVLHPPAPPCILLHTLHLPASPSIPIASPCIPSIPLHPLASPCIPLHPLASLAPPLHPCTPLHPLAPLFVCLFACLFVYLFVCLSFYLFVCCGVMWHWSILVASWR